MLKSLYISFFIILFSTCYSQDSENNYDAGEFKSDNILKTNPLAIIWGTIPYTAEYRLVLESFTAPKQSLQLGASYLGKSFILRIIEKQDTNMYDLDLIVKGFRFQFAYKYYFNREKQDFGFYSGPLFSYSMAKFTNVYYKNSDEYIRATYINYNIIAGYQTKIMDTFTFDIFTGLGYRDNYWIEKYNQTVSTLDDSDMYVYDIPLKIIFGFNIGILL